MNHSTVTAGQPIERKKTASLSVTMITKAATPVLQRDGGRSAIGNIIGIVSEVETVTLGATRGIAMSGIVATMAGNNTGVTTEIEAVTGDGTTTTMSAVTITQRIPLPLPGARREVAPGH